MPCSIHLSSKESNVIIVIPLKKTNKVCHLLTIVYIIIESQFQTH